MTLDPNAFPHQGYLEPGAKRAVQCLSAGAQGVATAGGLVASQVGPSGNVQIASGAAVILDTNTNQGSWIATNDAPTNVPIDPTSTNGRKDRVLLQVTPTGAQQFVVVKGVPAASPVEPSISGYTSAIELCMINIPASTTNITSGMITDRRFKLPGSGPLRFEIQPNNLGTVGQGIYELGSIVIPALGFPYEAVVTGNVNAAAKGAAEVQANLKPSGTRICRGVIGIPVLMTSLVQAAGVLPRKGYVVLGGGSIEIGVYIQVYGASDQANANGDSSNMVFRVEVYPL